jgi:hypothetical protein
MSEIKVGSRVRIQYAGGANQKEDAILRKATGHTGVVTKLLCQPQNARIKRHAVTADQKPGEHLYHIRWAFRVQDLVAI